MYDVVDEATFRDRCTEEVWAYTDGSASRTGQGGWGAVIGSGRIAVERYGAATRGGTSTAMELTAIVRALEFIGIYPGKQGAKIIDVFTDCRNLVDQIEDLPRKAAIGFRTEDGRGMPQGQLWRTVWRAMRTHTKLRLHWVRSHNGDPRNTRADELAKEGLSLVLPRDSQGHFINPLR